MLAADMLPCAKIAAGPDCEQSAANGLMSSFQIPPSFQIPVSRELQLPKV
jgi:hypothetical protein